MISKSSSFYNNNNLLFSVDTTQEPPLLTERHLTILGVVSGCLIVVVAIAICITCKQHKKEVRQRKHALKQEDRRNTVELTNLLHHQAESPHRGGHVTTLTSLDGTRRNGSLERNAISASGMTGGPHHNSTNHSRHNGYATGHHVKHNGQGNISRDPEYVDPIPSGSGTTSGTHYSVAGVPPDPDKSSPNAFSHTIPAVVTIERPEDNTSKNSLSREPSCQHDSSVLNSRPGSVKMKRDLSAEFNNPESNDSWKYLSDVTTPVPVDKPADDWYNSLGRKDRESRPRSCHRLSRSRGHSFDKDEWTDGAYRTISGPSLDEQSTYYDDAIYTPIVRQSSGRKSPDRNHRRNKSPLGRRTSPKRQKSVDDTIYVSPSNDRRGRRSGDFSSDQFYTRPNKYALQHHPI